MTLLVTSDMFPSRSSAGRQLAEVLNVYKNKDVLILGIPRGGVVVACEVAKALNAPLDILVIKKIGAQGNEELAIGAASADDIYLDPVLVADSSYVESETKKKQQEAKARYERLRGTKRFPAIKNKIVIVIDDGIATGATMKLAIKILKKKSPKDIIIAVPVASPDIVKELRKEAQVVCLEQHEDLMAIGQWYDNFTQVEEDEVKKLLE